MRKKMLLWAVLGGLWCCTSVVYAQASIPLLSKQLAILIKQLKYLERHGIVESQQLGTLLKAKNTLRKMEEVQAALSKFDLEMLKNLESTIIMLEQPLQHPYFSGYVEQTFSVMYDRFYKPAKDLAEFATLGWLDEVFAPFTMMEKGYIDYDRIYDRLRVERIKIIMAEVKLLEDSVKKLEKEVKVLEKRRHKRASDKAPVEVRRRKLISKNKKKIKEQKLAMRKLKYQVIAQAAGIASYNHRNKRMRTSTEKRPSRYGLFDSPYIQR